MSLLRKRHGKLTSFLLGSGKRGSRSSASMITIHVSLTETGMAQQRRVINLRACLERTTRKLTCVPDWKAKISKLGRIAWKFPPPHASLQTAKPDIVANKRKKEKKFKIRWVRRGTKDNIWYSQHKESYRLQTQLKNLWTNWEGDIL